jgi:hypothetical protein
MAARKTKPKPKRHKIASPSERAVIDQVIRLEKEVWEVAQNRQRKRFEELVPADAVMIFQSGILPQPQYLASMNGRTISRYELRNIRGFMPNATTVILLYEAVRVGDESGQSFPAGSVIESTTWIKRGNRWVAILNQETPMRSS